MESKTSRVLIVDDMAINRMVISSMLATHGVMSDQAESGRECLALCEKRDYDLILLDHRMPDLDGVDTLIRLKEIFKSRGREVPIVCHTTEDGGKNINLYKAAGFAEVLLKPIEPKELLEVLMTYLPDRKNSGDTDRESAKSELEKLPMWLKLVPHIDLVAGTANCGSADDYMEALYMFYSSIEEKSNDIEDFLNKKDWNMYALRVHSLKSMARLIGARKLGDVAARLEKDAREGDLETVRKDTSAFLKSYRDFSGLLSPFEEDNEIQRMIRAMRTSKGDAFNEPDDPDYSHSILFIQSGQGIVKKGIETNLTAAGFTVISIPDEPDRIIGHREDADIIIYYPRESDDAHIGITVNLLGEICRDDAKILCVIGDQADIKAAMLSDGAYRVSRSYLRPINIEHFVKDMEYFARLEQDYHRRKTVFVVDDDGSYLAVIERWLSADYDVLCFKSGEDVLKGLEATMPDLILLDYEMPEMNGCELMKSIRTSFPSQKIPIIFLTGKNDREHVFHVLEYRPDGYLLKTSQKENLLDVIQRFFAETMFRMSL